MGSSACHFGLKMSQNVFQMQMDQITDRLPGIIAIHDDICVYGNDTIEQNKNLLKTHAKCSRPWSSFSTATSVPSASPKFHFMEPFSQCKA